VDGSRATAILKAFENLAAESDVEVCDRGAEGSMVAILRWSGQFVVSLDRL
jgi:hypothetical protein